MVAVPPVGRSTVHRMRMVVVLPAPLGPSSPKISPGRASKLTEATAWTMPRRRSRKDFERLWTWIIGLAHEVRVMVLVLVACTGTGAGVVAHQLDPFGFRW